MDPFVANLVTSFGARNVVDYAQGEDTRLRDDPVLTGNGWCFGMSVHWLLAMKNGTDFWSWIRTTEAVSKIRFVMARQAIGFDKGAGWVDGSQAATGYLKAHGLSRLDAPVSDDTRVAFNGRTTPLRQKLESTNGPFSLVKLSGSAPHAMAAVARPGGAVVLMDPNCGQFEFDSPTNFMNFFRYLTADWRVFSGRSYIEADPQFRVDKFAAGDWREIRGRSDPAAAASGITLGGQRRPPAPPAPGAHGIRIGTRGR